ncbi:MAG: hypothetical protein HY867_01100 [Chloroflexi bacterium]|nr:hypothetical protein [Chloroflexota bacterium]
MSFRLKEKQNYSYLHLANFGLAFLVGLFLGVEFGLVMFCINIILFVILQLYSGIAIDRSGFARYRRDKFPAVFYLTIFPYALMGIVGLISIVNYILK